MIITNEEQESLVKEIDEITETLTKEDELLLSKMQRNKRVNSRSGKSLVMKKPINPNLAYYYNTHSSMLRNSTDILKNDIILNNSFDVIDNSDNEHNKDYSNIKNSILNSWDEIANAVQDYFLYGAGCLVIEQIIDSDEFRLTQTPQKYLQIIEEYDRDLDITEYFIEESSANKLNDEGIRYRILGEHYETVDSEELGEAIWFGGDQHYDFYTTPVWTARVILNSLNSQIAMSKLQTDKIQKGFNMNHVLLIQTPQMIEPPLSEEEDKIKDSFCNMIDGYGSESANEYAQAFYQAQTGTGMIVKEVPEGQKIHMDSINLTDTNYEALEAIYQRGNQEIISAFGIPRERYFINDIKESMNSHKTEAFWDIYIKKLSGHQNMITTALQRTNQSLYDCEDIVVSIESPMFSLIINSKIKAYKDLFLDNLLTKGQTIKLISKYITDLDLVDFDFNDPRMEEYNTSNIIHRNLLDEANIE